MSNFSIKEVFARQVYDSRGRPTVESVVVLDSGAYASAIAPSGASVGSLEAVELRDSTSIGVGGVATAVANVNTKIAKYLTGIDCRAQSTIDEVMLDLDGTENKSTLGANAILPTSLAVARVAANASDLPLFAYLGGLKANKLPVPLMNVINGGVHADNLLDIQEFMIVPVGAQSFVDALDMSSKMSYTIKEILKSRRLSVNVGDEGGFAADLSSTESVFDILILACERAGFVPGEDILFAIDVAASELYEDGKYHFKGEGERMKHDRLFAYYRNLCRNYPLFSIEDPIAENDSTGFIAMTEQFGQVSQIVGDDVFVTNKHLLREGINNRIANAILVKPNQVGTLTETMETIAMAEEGGYARILSHRSGETEDTAIAHLAVGLGANQIKAGALARTDRVAKYNELLRIEERIGKSARYAGEEVLEKYNAYRKNLG